MNFQWQISISLLNSDAFFEKYITDIFNVIHLKNLIKKIDKLK